MGNLILLLLKLSFSFGSYYNKIVPFFIWEAIEVPEEVRMKIESRSREAVSS